jgi:hypothetical protein
MELIKFPLAKYPDGVYNELKQRYPWGVFEAAEYDTVKCC